MPDFTTADLQTGRRDEDVIPKGEPIQERQQIEAQAFDLDANKDGSFGESNHGPWITCHVDEKGRQTFTFILDYGHNLDESEVIEYGLRVRPVQTDE